MRGDGVPRARAVVRRLCLRSARFDRLRSARLMASNDGGKRHGNAPRATRVAVVRLSLLNPTPALHHPPGEPTNPPRARFTRTKRD